MARRIGIIVAWLAATTVAVLIASAAVASVRSQVTDEPTPLGSPDAQALAADVTTSEPDGSVTTSTPATDAVAIRDSTTTTSGRGPSEGDPTASTTTSPTSSTTTTAASPAEPQSFTKTYDTDAGSIRIVVEGTSVTFGGAVPLPGWRVELEDDGPEKVKVHFEKNDEDGEIQFLARFEGGELEVGITTGDDD